MRMHITSIGALLVVATVSQAASLDRLNGAMPSTWVPAATSVDPSRQTPADGATKQSPTPEEIMDSRFPQPVRVGDLIGLPVLDYFDATIGYVRNVVRTPAGKIQLIVTQGGWPAGWSTWRARLVPVPIEVVAILGRQIVALEMSRDEFAAARTWSNADGQPIAPSESIRIAISRR
jgi:hypothetical protein